MRKQVHLIRHEIEDGERELCVHAPLYSHENFLELIAPLVQVLGGELGLQRMAWFHWEDYHRVRGFFEDLDYQITFIDAREEDRADRFLRDFF